MEPLDVTDLSILRILQKDSSLTTKELARHINLSPTPVYERVKKLEREGFIKKYVAILDGEKLDKELVVFCHITLKQHTREIGNGFVRDIQQFDEVTECYNTSGDYDFLLKVVVRDMKEYQNFVLNRLGSIDGIGNTRSTFAMGEIKQSYAIPL